MKHPQLPLLLPLNLWPSLPHYFPTLSDLATLPLFHPIFPCSSQCFNSIMDVHKAQFTSRAFPIISLVNSLAVPASLLHVFVATGLGALSVFAQLTLSLHQPDIQLLWQITPICLSVQHSACVKFPGTHYPCAHIEILQYNIRSKEMDFFFFRY